MNERYERPVALLDPTCGIWSIIAPCATRRGGTVRKFETAPRKCM